MLSSPLVGTTLKSVEPPRLTLPLQIQFSNRQFSRSAAISENTRRSRRLLENKATPSRIILGLTLLRSPHPSQRIEDARERAFGVMIASAPYGNGINKNIIPQNAMSDIKIDAHSHNDHWLFRQ